MAGIGSSEHFQFVRDLPYGCVLLVVGHDKLLGAEDLQDGIIFTLLQVQKGVDKFFRARTRTRPCAPRTRNRHRV
jgi:hypothetical protein